MSETFFCASCLRHKPIAAKGVNNPGTRDKCVSCVERVKVKAKRSRSNTAAVDYSTPLKRSRTDHALLRTLKERGEI